MQSEIFLLDEDQLMSPILKVYAQVLNSFIHFYHGLGSFQLLSLASTSFLHLVPHLRIEKIPSMLTNTSPAANVQVHAVVMPSTIGWAVALPMVAKILRPRLLRATREALRRGSSSTMTVVTRLNINPEEAPMNAAASNCQNLSVCSKH